MTPTPIYHLTPAGYYRRQAVDQPYVSPTLAEEGFMHCTAGLPLLLKVANAYFARLDEPLLALVIDPARLTSPLKFEAPAPPPGAARRSAYGQADVLFPHIYGPLNREAISAHFELARDAGGRWSLPPEVEK